MFTSPLLTRPDPVFSTLKSAFLRAGYDEQSAAQRAGASSIFEFRTYREREENAPPPADALDALLLLFMHGEPLAKSEFLRFFTAEELLAAEQAGLLAHNPVDAEVLYATAFVYPVGGVYVASDRTFLPAFLPGSRLPADAVFAAITVHTRNFLAMLPQDACEHMLDLCSGSGVAALQAGARYAKRAWATDLGARCVQFAEFSRHLNGLENVATAQGDLYSAVGSETFDRITAHPPYIPAKESKLLFRDGGEDGEQVFRRCIEGIPGHLRPGGRFYALTFATDRQEAELEDRVRAWLGPDQKNFSILIVGAEVRRRPAQMLRKVIESKSLRLGESGEHLERLGVTGLFYGTVIVQRAASGQRTFSARTLQSEETGFPAVEEFRRYRTAVAEVDSQREILQLRARLQPSVQLQINYVPAESGLFPESFLLRVREPWTVSAEVGPWVAEFLTLCDGNRSLGEICQALRSPGAIGEDVAEAEMFGAVRELLMGGFIEPAVGISAKATSRFEAGGTI